jgi:HEAT repeat protein
VLAEGVVEVLAPAFHQYLLRCAPPAPSRYFAQMQQHATIAPLRDGDRVVGTLVTIADVTARLERERALAEQLTGADERARLDAARALAEGGESAPLLAGALGDASWRVRQAAASGLARHGGPEAIAVLLRALTHEHRSPSVLNSALHALALTGAETLAPLTECLRDEDIEVRMYSAHALGLRNDPRAIPYLLGALEDPDANVRYHVVEALGLLRARPAIDRLLAIAESGDFFVAFAAVDALRRIGDPRVLPRLLALLDDALLPVPVIDALGELGDLSVAAPLAAQLNGPDAPIDSIVRALAGLYGRYESEFGEGGYLADEVRRAVRPEGVVQVVTALAEVAPDARRDFALVLGWFEDAEAQRALARLLAEPEPRDAVVDALVRRGAESTPLLVAQLQAGDPDVREAAAHALGQIGDPRAVPALLELLDGDPALVGSAAHALARIGDRRAFDALLGLLGHPDVTVRQAAVGALNSLGHPDTPREALRLLQDRDPLVRESAVKIAGYFGYPESGELLLERCQDEDERVRRAAVEHLPYLDDARALPALLRALEGDEAPGVRAAAARALAQADPERALPALLGVLHNGDAWVRYFAAQSLGRLGRPEAVEPLARLADSDPAPPVRIAAVEALGRCGGPRSLAVLAPLSASADIDLARAALAALGRLDDRAALPPLLAALESPDPQRRIHTLEALGASAFPEALDAIRTVAAGDPRPEVIEAAIAALARLRTREGVAALVELCRDAPRRAAAVAALAHLPDEQLAWLGESLAHPQPDVRGALVEALAHAKRPEATAWLGRALDDVDAGVRLTAASALQHLSSHGLERRLAALAYGDPEAAVRQAATAALQRGRMSRSARRDGDERGDRS